MSIFKFIKLQDLQRQYQCNHKFFTVTNLGGDAINWFSCRKTMFPRSIKKCIHCKKIELSECLDENCKKINFKK